MGEIARFLRDVAKIQNIKEREWLMISAKNVVSARLNRIAKPAAASAPSVHQEMTKFVVSAGRVKVLKNVQKDVRRVAEFVRSSKAATRKSNFDKYIICGY